MKKQLLAIMLLAATVSLKAQNPYPVIPIDSVQFVSQSKLTATPVVDLPDYISPTFVNPTYRDTVRFDGVVISSPRTYGLSTNRKATYVQKEGGGPWSGVLVMCDPSTTPAAGRPTLPNFITETKFYENMVPGYKVRITGKFANFQGETQMNVLRNNANWSNAVEQVDLNTYQPVYTVISADSLMTGNPTAGTWLQKKATGEKWEGVLVEIRDVRVVGVTPFGGTRWNWAIQDNAGNQLDVRDFSAYFRNDDNEDTIPKIPNNFTPPAFGTGLTFIRGVITEYQIGGISRYGISPLSPSDIGPCNVCPPSIGLRTRVPSIVSQNDSVTISATILADTAITTAKLYYAHKDSLTFNNVDMIKEATSDKWGGRIPPYPANTLVKYYIKVVDGRNLSTVVPDTLANGSLYYVTADGIKNIRELQFAPNPANGATVWNGDSLIGINVHGVVTATNMNNQTIIQDGQGPNSAIFIQNSIGNNNWKIGDSVEITAARVTENFNVTTLYNLTGSVIKSKAVMPVFEMNLPIDSFRLNNIRFARPWEGVLVKWDSTFVVNLNADSNANGDNFGEFVINTDSTKTNGLRVDDLNNSILNLNRTLVKGQFLTYAQGPMTFSFSNFKLIPRNLSDLGLCNMDTVKPSMIVPATDTVFVGSGAYTHPNLTASDNKDGNLTSYIITDGTVNTAALGSYTVTYSVSDFCGNMAMATRTVIVKDTPNTGLERNDVVAANISIYPNPAKDVITISATDVKTLPLNIAVYDMIGREMLTRSYNDKNVNETININNFNNGVYFLVMKNAQGTHSVKFVVTGK
jgi:hypothetical protein